MILKYILYLIFLLQITSLNASINLDYHITSKINTTDILFFNNQTLVSTTGGVYNVSDTDYVDIDLLDALNISDLSDPDLNGRIWMSSINSGIMQVLDSNNKITNVISYPTDIDGIFNIKHSFDKTFAIGCRGECLALESMNNDYFLIVYDGYYFNNIINNFPVLFNNINDIEIYQDYIYVATDNGLLSSSINNNLLISSNWQHTYESEYISSITNNIAIANGNFINISNNTMYDYSNYQIEGEIVQLYDFLNDGTYHLLTTKNMYSISSDFLITNNITLNKDVNITSNFTCAAYDSDSFYFGMFNNGFVKYANFDDLYTFYSPKTLFQNKFTAISVSDDYLAGISKRGGFIISNINSLENINIFNFYPYGFSDTSLYSSILPNNISDFNSRVLPYWSGGKNPKSILLKNNNLFFANSGSYPFIDDNITFHYTPILNQFFDDAFLPPIDYYGALGFFHMTYETENLQMKSNGIFGGLGGYLDENETSGYMTVGQIKSDQENNVWVVNPFCENYFENNQRINRPLAYKLFNDSEWNHVYDTSLEYFIPTEIAFSEQNRIWVGYKFYEKDDAVYSLGGIRMLEYNNINDERDDIWYSINSNEYDNVNVWSVEVTKDETGKEILWVLSDYGLKGYYFDVFDVYYGLKIVELYAYNDIFYFSDLSISEGCKIRSDFDNNLWLLTVNDGLRIIYNNGAISTLSLTKENFNILSNNITDIGFHKNGDVYISTDLGISVLNTSFTTRYSPSTLSVSPNPFFVSDNNEIIFSNIGPNTKIQLITLNGIVLKDFFVSYNRQIIDWNGTANNGEKIPSGVYLLVSSNLKQNSGVTKLAILR